MKHSLADVPRVSARGGATRPIVGYNRMHQRRHAVHDEPTGPSAARQGLPIGVSPRLRRPQRQYVADRFLAPQPSLNRTGRGAVTTEVPSNVLSSMCHSVVGRIALDRNTSVWPTCSKVFSRTYCHSAVRAHALTTITSGARHIRCAGAIR